MLNISKHNLNNEEELNEFNSMQHVKNRIRFLTFNKVIVAILLVTLVFMFLPWTQNVRGEGNVTTLDPSQRPQGIQSAIPGRIEKWYVGEGDIVKKGDTIVYISEIKSEYFDPDLLNQTRKQISSKAFSQMSYQQKAEAIDRNIAGLRQEQKLKLEMAQNKLLQANLKVESDSIDLEAAKTQLSIAQRQFARTDTLEGEGLLARKDREDKELKLQQSQAKLISQQNKLLESRNEVLNAEIEINKINTEYLNKIAKAESDRASAISNQYSTEADVAKLENTFNNYRVRDSIRYIRAPQDGFINRAIQKGIGETFKEGAEIVSIMPLEIDLAVETFVRPIDLPLLYPGEKVRLIFDGWPAIFFSGWPNMSFGTYGGVVVAVERNISPNGRYRVLIKPDPEEQEWPQVIRAGSGSKTFALLNDVPIWYEIWRQINGFPPDFYVPENKNSNMSKK